jgi:glycosyltransferase involved in cell wall biosynthesis
LYSFASDQRATDRLLGAWWPLNPRAPVVVVSGKDPLEAPGGYAAYGHNLCRVLCSLGHPVHIVALGSRDVSMATDVGQLHLVRNGLASRVSFIADVQMAALPLYSYSFAKRIGTIVGRQPCLIWGLGPWALAGAVFKNRSPASTLIASYFTTFLHEMRGSLAAIRIGDYGLRLKLQYGAVVGVIGPVFRQMERFLMNRTDIVVTHYRSTEEMLSAELGVPRQKFHRMTYYTEVFDRPAPSPLLEHPPKPLVVTVCRQDPRKGINFLLHAMALLAARGVAAHCLVAGGGSMLQENQRLAARLRVADRVTFAGFVGDVRPMLEAADVFVFPAVEEGAGSLSVLEAMSVGAPMVVTNIDGLPEDVEHGQSALMVPSRDPAALADALQTVLSDRALAQRLGHGARAAYERKFSMAAMQRDVEALLGTLNV